MTLAQHALAGDLVVVDGHRLGESRRMGEILEVLGRADHEHYRVRWEDDRETIFYPAGDALVRRGRRGGPRRPRVGGHGQTWEERR
jgi:hypothetical protein